MSDAYMSSSGPKFFCSVTMCRNFNNPYSAIDLYKLPQNVLQRTKFSEILGIPLSVALSDSARVCALHFKSKMKNQPPPPGSVQAQEIKSTQVGTTTPGRPKIITVYCQKSTSNTNTTTSCVMNLQGTKPTVSMKPEIETISLEDDNSDLTSFPDDPVEQSTDMSLELQCEEEPLSLFQLNSQLNAQLTANPIVETLPPITPTVKTSTTSTQTDPIVIFDFDEIAKLLPPKTISSEESSQLNSAVQNIKITPQVENSAVPLKEPSALKSLIGLVTSVTDDASLNSPMPIAIDISSILPNNPVLVPQSVCSENAASASLVSLANMAGGTYLTTTISPTTIPSTTVTTPFALGEKSKLYTYLNQNSSLRQPSGSFPNSPVTFIPPVPSGPSHRVQGMSSTIIQPTYFQNTGQSLLRTSMSASSAPSTMLTFASSSNYPTQLVKTSCGLALNTSIPQEPVNCIPFPNQIRLETGPPPPYQLSLQQPFQLISLNEKSGVLSSFSQPLDQQKTNDAQLLGPYSNCSFNSDPYSNRYFNSQEFQNYTIRNANETTPYQVLVQKNDNTKYIFSNNIPGAPQSVFNAGSKYCFNTSEFPSQVPVTSQDDSTDKDDDLLAMCNVATIYGSGSSTPTEGAGNSDSNTATEGKRKRRSVHSTSKTNSNHNTIKEPTTRHSASPDSDWAPDTDTAESDSSENSVGPLIVDVISATEGGKDYYVGNKIPNTLFGKNKAVRSKKLKKKTTANKIDATKETKVYSSNVNKQGFTNTSKNDSSATVASKDKQGETVHLLFQKNNGPMQAVKLHNSVFSLQTTIPIIPNGQQLGVNPQTLLELKTPIGKMGMMDANSLRKKLTNENFISCSVWWLVRRSYMPLAPPCHCGSYTFKVIRNAKYVDGFCWKCASASCGIETQMKRPKVFESFKTYTLEELLLLTYHWACQSPLKEILMDVNLNCEQILAYFKALQDICHKMILKKCKLGVSSDAMVETGLVKMGSIFIIGAFDRKNRHTRLEAISQIDAYSSTVHIELLKNWLCKQAVLVSDKMIAPYLLPETRTVSADPNVTDPTSNKPHILNISKYLVDNLTAIFGKVNQNYLSIDVVQGFLNELQWRGKYAKFFDVSFWSIMNHIREFNDSNEARTIAIPGDFNVVSYRPTDEFCIRWGVPLADKSEETTEKVVNTQLKVARPSSSFLSQKPIIASSRIVENYDLSYINSQVLVKPGSKKITTVKQNIPPKINSQVLMTPDSKEIPTAKRKISSKVQSASEMFQDVPEIPGGSSNITSNTLLAIKIRCEDSTPPGVYKPNATSLGLQLRTEGFISDPVSWLVRRGYVSSKSSCYVCKGPTILQQNSKYKDGCSWLCQNPMCKFENMFKRPQFFARFNGQTMAQVAAMIFHWTVQSDYNIIKSDVPIDSVQVSHAWRVFQAVCSSALKRDVCKIGGALKIVEVAMVQFGKLYIFGARERLTKRTLLKCFPAGLYNQVDFFYQTIESWVREETCVVINSTSLFNPLRWSKFRFFSADTSITEKTNPRMHVLNITSYLLKHIFEMFGHLQADLVGHELMQFYLNELMWREKFGKLPNLAFAKIMYEIFYHEKSKSTLLLEQHKVKELMKEKKGSPDWRKEIRVILHRIPETVLRHYKCLPSDYATSKKLASVATGISDSEDESSDSSEDLMAAVSAALEGESLSDVSSSELNDKPIDNKKSSSLQAKNKTKALEEANQNNNTPKDRTMPRAFEESKLPTSKRKPVNSVQPLVLKMNKNRKNYQSYLKSEFLKAKYKKQRSRSKFNQIRKVSRKKKKVKKEILEDPQILENPQTLEVPQASVKDSFLETKIKIEPGTSGLDQTLSPASDYASGGKSQRKLSHILRKLGTYNEPVCVECGKVISFDHFMKQFNCTDCKNTVYTTCCSTAFFEHRSALLFGKRMPRRDKVAHGHGLHHPRVLPHAAICPCGFKSKIGNQIASHMVKCQEITCFYNRL